VLTGAADGDHMADTSGKLVFACVIMASHHNLASLVT